MEFFLNDFLLIHKTFVKRTTRSRTCYVRMDETGKRVILIHVHRLNEYRENSQLGKHGFGSLHNLTWACYRNAIIRTSCFDNDFVSKIKLTKFPEINCFLLNLKKQTSANNYNQNQCNCNDAHWGNWHQGAIRGQLHMKYDSENNIAPLGTFPLPITTSP